MHTSNAFVAIDFETSHTQRDSACAVALVRVEAGAITQRERRLIQPPRRAFMFTDIHGIRWRDVQDAPRFAEVWRELSPLLDGVDFLAAHNASFDRGVLNACCASAGLQPPALPWVCTVKLARKAWRLYPTRLPDAAAHIGFTLNHHEPLSDAECCAQIVLQAS